MKSNSFFLWSFAFAAVVILGCEEQVNTVVQAPDDPDFATIDVDAYEQEMASVTNENKKEKDRKK